MSASSGVGVGRVDYSCSAEKPDGGQGISGNSGDYNVEQPSQGVQRLDRRAGNPGSHHN